MMLSLTTKGLSPDGLTVGGASRWYSTVTANRAAGVRALVLRSPLHGSSVPTRFLPLLGRLWSVPSATYGEINVA